MKSIWKHLVPGALLLSGALLFGAGGAIGQAAPPAVRFFGSVQVNGANAPQGAAVTAFVGSTTCTSSTGAGNGIYNGTQFVLDIDAGQAACGAGATVGFKVNGAPATQTATIPSVSNAVQINLTVTGSGGSGTTITYQPGWNLVSGPGGTVFSQASGTLYTLTATSGGNYSTQPTTQAVASGTGYWAYFTGTTSVSLNGTSQSSASVVAPAGQFIMVGNPSGTNSVTVSGADIVYTYTPSGGYVTSNTLAPGQGAWAYSAAGATLTIQ